MLIHGMSVNDRFSTVRLTRYAVHIQFFYVTKQIKVLSTNCILLRLSETPKKQMSSNL